MSEKEQSNEKDKKLIKDYISREEAAEEEFYMRFKPKIFAIAMEIIKNETEAEDLTQDIFKKISEEIGKHEIQHLDGWVATVAFYYCIDDFRKQHTKKALEFSHPIVDKDKGTSLVEVAKDSKAIPPGSKEYYKQDEELYINIDTLYKRNFSQKARKDLEFSLRLIEIFYHLIREIKSNPAYCERILKIHKILLNTKKKVNRVVDPISKEEIKRYNWIKDDPPDYLSTPEKKELERLKKQESFIHIHSTLNEMADRINSMVYGMGLRDFLSAATNAPPQAEYYQAEYYLYQLFDLALKLKTMKIKPPRLMYSVWVKGLRKGKYTNRKKIMLVFLYFKRKTKGTKQEFLFDSIDENLSNFESIRKSYYKMSPNDRVYKELVDAVYKHSFVYNREANNF